MWSRLLFAASLVTVVSGYYCPKEEKQRLNRCLDPIHPLLNKPDNPPHKTCKIITSFIRCVELKLPLCKDFLTSTKVLNIAYDMKQRYCFPSSSTTTTTPPPTTKPPPSVHMLFSRCRNRYRRRKFKTRGEACRSAQRFLKCGRSVLWSHEFSIDTFYLHAELLRNRAVFWRVCARRTLQQKGVGRGKCPPDFAKRLSACINITYWQQVVPGDIKTFCRIGPVFLPCLTHLADGCHHVGRLHAMADFLWNTFDLLSDRCAELGPVNNNALDYEYDYDYGVPDYRRPPPVQTDGGGREPYSRKPHNNKDVKPSRERDGAASAAAAARRKPAKNDVQTARLPAQSHGGRESSSSSSSPRKAPPASKAKQQRKEKDARKKQKNEVRGKAGQKAAPGKESSVRPPDDNRGRATARERGDNPRRPSGSRDEKDKGREAAALQASKEDKPQGSKTTPSSRKDAVRAKQQHQQQSSRTQQQGNNKTRAPEPLDPGASTPSTRKEAMKAKLKAKEASQRRKNNAEGGGRRLGSGGRSTTPFSTFGAQREQKQKEPLPARAKPDNGAESPDSAPTAAAETSPQKPTNQAPRRRPQNPGAPLKGSQPRRKTSGEEEKAEAGVASGPAGKQPPPNTRQEGGRREGEKKEGVQNGGRKKEKQRTLTSSIIKLDTKTTFSASFSASVSSSYVSSSSLSSSSSSSSIGDNPQIASTEDSGKPAKPADSEPTGETATFPWSAATWDTAARRPVVLPKGAAATTAGARGPADKSTALPRPGAAGTSSSPTAQAEPTSAVVASSSPSFPAVTGSGLDSSRGTRGKNSQRSKAGARGVGEKQTKERPPQGTTKPSSPELTGRPDKKPGKGNGADSQNPPNNAVVSVDDTALSESLSGDNVPTEAPSSGDDVSSQLPNSALSGDNVQETSGGGGSGGIPAIPATGPTPLPSSTAPRLHGAAVSSGEHEDKGSPAVVEGGDGQDADTAHGGKVPQGDKAPQSEETVEELSSITDHDNKAGRPNAAASNKTTSPTKPSKSDAGQTSTTADSGVREPATRPVLEEEPEALQPVDVNPGQDSRWSGRAGSGSGEGLPGVDGNAAPRKPSKDNADETTVAGVSGPPARSLESSKGFKESSTESGLDTTTLTHSADTKANARKKPASKESVEPSELSSSSSGDAATGIQYPSQQRVGREEEESEDGHAEGDTKTFDTTADARASLSSRAVSGVTRAPAASSESTKNVQAGTESEVRATLAEIISGKDRKRGKANPGTQIETATNGSEPQSQKSDKEGFKLAETVAKKSDAGLLSKVDKDVEKEASTETSTRASGAEPPSLKSEKDDAMLAGSGEANRQRELAAMGEQDADAVVMESTPIYDDSNDPPPPWGRNCSTPWEGHRLCTAIMLRYALAGQGFDQCRSLQHYILCLSDLKAACNDFLPFDTIPGTISYITTVFNDKCPGYSVAAFQDGGWP